MDDGAVEEDARLLRAVPWPEAEQLATLLSIRNDLIFVQNCTRIAYEVLEKEGSSAHQTVVRGLWNAGLVAYSRAFATGKRGWRLTENDVDAVEHDGDKGLLNIHKFMMDTRSKYVAHSVNGFESCQVGVTAAEDGSGAEMSWGYMHYTSPEKDGILTLGVLAMRLVERVESRMWPLREACEARLEALSPAEVKLLPAARFDIASSKESHIPR